MLFFGGMPKMRKIEEYDNYCYYAELEPNTKVSIEECVKIEKTLNRFLTWDCEQIHNCDALKAFSTIPLCEECPHNLEEN